MDKNAPRPIGMFLLDGGHPDGIQAPPSSYAKTALVRECQARKHLGCHGAKHIPAKTDLALNKKKKQYTVMLWFSHLVELKKAAHCYSLGAILPASPALPPGSTHRSCRTRPFTDSMSRNGTCAALLAEHANIAN